MVSVTRPSPSMRMKALGSKAAGGGPGSAGKSKPSSRPPPTAAPTRSNSRRDTRRGRGVATSAGRRPLDGGADTRIGAAAADVARQARVDIGVRGVWLGREQRGRGHDL